MVIGIVGMGGIGKTTLAEKVCKSPDFNSHFKHSFLVSVSHTFDLADLLKRMLKKLNVEETSNEVDDLSERLKSKLDGRYLLVLDDVWQTDEKMWWDCLEAALPRRHGCCIIVTTRNDEVAKSMGAMDKHIHQQIFLSEGESWSLFKKVAFVREGDERINHELEYIGKKIVRSCGGLPLAIKIVGGMMSKESSIDEWKRISKHLKEEMSNNKKDELVSSVLRLSYDELPSHLKPCFLSFAMYPENFEINTRNMIYGWIGEGLVWGKNGKTAYEFGEQCFAELLSRCLILGEYKDAFERTFYTWKMHDLVRDLVIKIAKDENFMCVDEKGRLALSVRSRRTGIIRSSFTETFQPTTNLRALVWIDIDCKNIRRNICKLRWLRVLYLSFSSTSIYTEVWMSALGSLPHLVYLTIGKSNVKKLPNSLGNLRKLQIFRLFDCPNLKSLPPTISNLEKLTILFLRECPSIEFFPEGLGKLSKLEQLFGFKPTKLKCKNSFRIEQLKNLTELREIGMDISSKDQFEEGGLNVLQELPCLKVLAIDCSDNDGSIEFMEKLHQSLSPLKSLQELWLGDFPSRKTPPWLNPTTLPSLQRLYISRWWKLTQMGPKFYDMNQEESWKIEVLVLKYLDELEVDCPRIQKAIPKLRLVKISGCSKLKSFHLDDEGDGERNGEWRQEKDGWRRHYD